MKEQNKQEKENMESEEDELTKELSRALREAEEKGTARWPDKQTEAFVGVIMSGNEFPEFGPKE